MNKIRLTVPIIALLVGGLLLYVLGKWQGASGTENAAVIQAAHQALAMGKANRARLDSLRHAAAQRVTTVRIRDTVIVRLTGQLERDTSARDSVRTLLLVQDTLIAQRDSLLSAVRLLMLHADSSDARVAILESNLRATLKIADCHVLGASWLPRCPSRTASFLLGGGIAGTLALVTR
jgi:hypothetical protein